jgi:hypothetical protein
VIIVKSVNSVHVRLTVERWSHVVARHPEMEGQRDAVLDTLSAPDLVQEGDLGTSIAVRFYEKTPLTSKHLVVIYKETSSADGFVLTAYYTARPSARRQTIWKQ